MTNSILAWMERPRPRLNRIYRVIAPVLVVFCLVSSLFASVGVSVIYAGRDEARQQRVDDFEAIFDCFESYLNNGAERTQIISEKSEFVSQMTVLRDDAMADRDQVLGNFLDFAAASSADPQPEDEARSLEIFLNLRDKQEELRQAQGNLRMAQDELQTARDENPPPPAPKEFCQDAVDLGALSPSAS